MDANADNESEPYIQALKQGGLRITNQRRAICKYLARTQTHPTPTQVYAYVAQERPDISRATVYNTLKALRDLGAIVEISVGGDHTHYDTDPSPHINLVCLRCGQVSDYKGDKGDVHLNDLYDVIRAETGFQAVSAQVQMVGFCAACQERRRAEIRQQLQERRSEPPEDQSEATP